MDGDVSTRQRRRAARRPRRGRSRGVRRAVRPPSRPALGGRPAHDRRPRVRPPTASRTGWSRRSGGPAASAATRRSRPGCTGSSSTRASTGCARRRYGAPTRCPTTSTRRAAARSSPPPTAPTSTSTRPSTACAASDGRWCSPRSTSSPRAAGRAGAGRHGGLPRCRGGPDPRLRRGHREEPLRARAGQARRLLRPLLADDTAGSDQTGATPRRREPAHDAGRRIHDPAGTACRSRRRRGLISWQPTRAPRSPTQPSSPSASQPSPARTPMTTDEPDEQLDPASPEDEARIRGLLSGARVTGRCRPPWRPASTTRSPASLAERGTSTRCRPTTSSRSRDAAAPGRGPCSALAAAVAVIGGWVSATFRHRRTTTPPVSGDDAGGWPSGAPRKEGAADDAPARRPPGLG